LSRRQYAGTGALKSGFTRTGKRTLAGLIDDGVKSMTRYYLNNFKVYVWGGHVTERVTNRVTECDMEGGVEAATAVMAVTVA
jgi:hypothetical protein